MITDELFTREFETFHFKEIHRNPPKSLLKPPAGLFGRLDSILAGGRNIYHNLPSGDSDMYAELEKELAKREPNFYDYLIYYMDQKHFDKEADLYRKAEISRAVFSKIRSMRETDHRPSKATVIKLCLALELDEEQTQEMLHTVGYGMSNSSLVDKIIMFFIKHKIYDIFEIDEAIHDKTNQNYLVDVL